MPPPPGPWPGVVVIHEAFGLNDDIRQKADQFAAHGYLALAPDLYDGSLAAVRTGVFRQLRAESGPAFTSLEAARRSLAARDDCSGKVGVIGFCLGGVSPALRAPGGLHRGLGELRRGPEGPGAGAAGACPIVGSYGGRDQMGTKPPERLQRALTVLEVPHDIEVYPGSGHRFMTQASGPAAVMTRFTRMSYQAADAADAWRRIYVFFGEHIGGYPLRSAPCTARLHGRQLLAPVPV